MKTEYSRYGNNIKTSLEKREPKKVTQFKKDALTMTLVQLGEKYSISPDTAMKWKQRYGLLHVTKNPGDKMLLKLIKTHTHQDIANIYEVTRGCASLWVKRAKDNQIFKPKTNDKKGKR